MHSVSMNPQRKHNKIAEHKTCPTKSIDLQIQYHDPLATGTESNCSQQLQYPLSQNQPPVPQACVRDPTPTASIRNANASINP